MFGSRKDSTTSSADVSRSKLARARRRAAMSSSPPKNGTRRLGPPDARAAVWQLKAITN